MRYQRPRSASQGAPVARRKSTPKNHSKHDLQIIENIKNIQRKILPERYANVAKSKNYAESDQESDETSPKKDSNSKNDSETDLHMFVEEVKEDKWKSQKSDLEKNAKKLNSIIEKNTKNLNSSVVGSPKSSSDEKMNNKPINGQVFPPYLPRANCPGRNTNQLK